MTPLDQARAQVHEAVRESTAPVVAVSFGKDSLLLLALAREVWPEIPCLWFRSAANTEQVAFAREIIRAWNLDVYSYEPVDAYLLASGPATALVQEYSFGAAQLPLVTDIAPGERCSLSAFPARTEQLFLPWDALLVGYKDCDSHWLKGDNMLLFADGFTLSHTVVHAPIRHLTDDQVRAAICELNIPYRELDDRVSLCTACMTHTSDEVWCPDTQRYIPRVQWDAEQSLMAFWQRFELNGGNDGQT